MTRQKQTAQMLAMVCVNLLSNIARLEEDISEAEGGNLAEVYGGARDHLEAALVSVRAALGTLAPEDE